MITNDINNINIADLTIKTIPQLVIVRVYLRHVRFSTIIILMATTHTGNNHCCAKRAEHRFLTVEAVTLLPSSSYCGQIRH